MIVVISWIISAFNYVLNIRLIIIGPAVMVIDYISNSHYYFELMNVTKEKLEEIFKVYEDKKNNTPNTIKTTELGTCLTI